MHAHALCARARTLSAHACTLRVCGRSSGALYSKEISSWLQKYGSKPTSVDETLFKLQRGNDIILLSLYVDDGACATNSEALYQQFIKDLQAKYKLLDQGDLKWHLSMKIARDANTGAISFDQRACKFAYTCMNSCMASWACTNASTHIHTQYALFACIHVTTCIHTYQNKCIHTCMHTYTAKTTQTNTLVPIQ